MQWLSEVDYGLPLPVKGPGGRMHWPEAIALPGGWGRWLLWLSGLKQRCWIPRSGRLQPVLRKRRWVRQPFPMSPDVLPGLRLRANSSYLYPGVYCQVETRARPARRRSGAVSPKSRAARLVVAGAVRAFPGPAPYAWSASLVERVFYRICIDCGPLYSCVLKHLRYFFLLIMLTRLKPVFPAARFPVPGLPAFPAVSGGRLTGATWRFLH